MLTPPTQAAPLLAVRHGPLKGSITLNGRGLRLMAAARSRSDGRQLAGELDRRTRLLERAMSPPDRALVARLPPPLPDARAMCECSGAHVRVRLFVVDATPTSSCCCCGARPTVRDALHFLAPTLISCETTLLFGGAKNVNIDQLGRLAG